MFQTLYWRMERGVIDSRCWADIEELSQWLAWINESEKVVILGIYQKGEEERYFADIERFRQRYNAS